MVTSEHMAPAHESSAPRGRGSSQFRGVLWDKSRNKWAARISVDDQCRSLGRFDDEIEAAEAYDAAARVEHGEFARLNFPTEEERERASRWVDKREACRMFEISLPAWKRWEKDGLIRGVRSRRRAYYDIEQLKALVPDLGPLPPPYPDPERPGCYRVPLAAHRRNGRPGEAIIDAEWLPLVQGNRFYLNSSKGSLAYVALSRHGECTPLHRMIMEVTDSSMEIKHVNDDPLDCRRENLVVVTHAEKVRGNRKMGTLIGRTYTSRFKGVCWDKRREKWLVQIRVEGTPRAIGRFDDEAMAAMAYDEAAREYFGEHAWLNFPGEGERGGAHQQDADDQSLRLAA